MVVPGPTGRKEVEVDNPYSHGFTSRVLNFLSALQPCTPHSLRRSPRCNSGCSFTVTADRQDKGWFTFHCPFAVGGMKPVRRSCDRNSIAFGKALDIITNATYALQFTLRRYIQYLY